jgi:YD repeat-containing protein
MTYDGENRPLSVTSANGDLTEYVYGADGTRLKRTVTEDATTTTSLYLGGIEIVNPAAGAASSEVVNWYPHPNVKIANTRGIRGHHHLSAPQPTRQRGADR